MWTLSYRVRRGTDSDGAGDIDVKARQLAVVTALGLVVSAGVVGTPASAAVPLVLGTGLQPGQWIGIEQTIRPDFAGGAVSVEVLVNNKILVKKQPRTADGIVLQPPADLNDTEADITVKAYDNFGGFSSLTTRVRVDTQAPTATFTPGLTDLIHGSTAVTATPDADVVEFVMFDADGKELGRTGTAPWTLTFDATGHSGHLNLQLQDRAGNITKVRSDFRVDDLGPTVDAVTPGDRVFVNGTTLTSTITATDPSGVAEATLLGAPTDVTAPFTATLPMGADGARILTWTVKDRWGNASVFRRVVRVDNTRPTLSIVAPPSGTKLAKGLLRINATGGDLNGIQRIEMRVNNRVVATDTVAPFSFVLDTRLYGSSFAVSFYAFDPVGNASSTRPRTYTT
jgi:hypothetical protein